MAIVEQPYFEGDDPFVEISLYASEADYEPLYSNDPEVRPIGTLTIDLSDLDLRDMPFQIARSLSGEFRPQ